MIYNCLEYGSQDNFAKEIQQNYVMNAVKWVDNNLKCEAVE